MIFLKSSYFSKLDGIWYTIQDPLILSSMFAGEIVYKVNAPASLCGLYIHILKAGSENML